MSGPPFYTLLAARGIAAALAEDGGGELNGAHDDAIFGSHLPHPEDSDVTMKLDLAIQCARSVTVLHQHDPPICHRDIKMKGTSCHRTLTNSAETARSQRFHNTLEG